MKWHWKCRNFKLNDLILYTGKRSVQDDPDSLWALVGCVRDKTSVCFVIVNTSYSDGCLWSHLSLQGMWIDGLVSAFLLLLPGTERKEKDNFLFQPEQHDELHMHLYLSLFYFTIPSNLICKQVIYQRIAMYRVLVREVNQNLCISMS